MHARGSLQKSLDTGGIRECSLGQCMKRLSETLYGSTRRDSSKRLGSNIDAYVLWRKHDILFKDDTDESDAESDSP
uniref:Uncharacterized protein n=1 Tax=Arundo donax TaxID=35708 RepID=A0A0A8YWY4_ARUDO